MKKLIGFIFAIAFCFLGQAQASVVAVEKTSRGWQLKVDDQSYFIRGISYNPTKIGESPDNQTLRDWMIVDDDKDGQIDVAYQSWVDKNRNNIQDANEPQVGDFQLLEDMGVNTMRLYHHATADEELQSLHVQKLLYAHAPNKVLLRDLYSKYGIRSMVGDFLGAYTIGSGANWQEGTDYTNPQQKSMMLKSVENMVREFKDEPFVLMWALGNENNYGQETHTNADKNPVAYAQFVNEVAEKIHQMDPNHPVVLVNGEVRFIDVYAKHAPAVDIIGINCYRSGSALGAVYQEIASKIDKPVLITEYGTQNPKVINNELDEIRQMEVHMGDWHQILDHSYSKKAPANAIGGFAFEWLDSWWRDASSYEQNLSQNEWNLEWHGLVSQGNGQNSPLMRQLRNVYYAYQKLWKNENK